MPLININKLKEEAAKTAAKAKEAAEQVAKKAQVTADNLGVTEALNNAANYTKQQAQTVSKFAGDTSANVSQFVKDASANVADTATKLANNIAESEWLQNTINTLTDAANVAIKNTNGALHFVGDKAQEIIADEQTQKILSATTEAAQKTGKITVKGLKVISGVQAVQDRKKSIANKEEADQLKAEIESTTEALRDDLNDTLEVFGAIRMNALKRTVGLFLNYLERMNQRSKAKEYDFLKEIDMKPEELAEMKQVDMKATEAAKVLAVGGGFAAIGLVGTPFLVTGLVTTFAAASTGTAISSLSGAAATNAVLAWLGGGAVAAGGGGMAAGAAVLTTITATATAGLAIVAVGTLASAFYAKKNTESEQYLADIKTWAAETEQSWIALNAIKARVLEMQSLTEELETRAMMLLGRMEPFVDCFNPQNQQMLETFQQTAIAVKSMSELAQTPILDEEGNISQAANIVIAKTEKVLNKKL